MIHTEPHPLAGQTVTLETGNKYHIEDWWDRVSGQSWTTCQGNPGCIHYAVRIGLLGILTSQRIPLDDEVVYGKINGLGHLLHVTELSTPDVPASEPDGETE